MKKRILSIVVLALIVLSAFALSACGKNGEKEKIYCPVENCGGELLDTSAESNAVYCEKNSLHMYKICANEECGDTIGLGDAYCPDCGASQVACPECGDGEIDGVYCTSCGRQVQKDGKMKFKLDFGALGESAMILCKGMLGIFIVTGVIIAFILVLNTVVEKVKQSKENKK